MASGCSIGMFRLQGFHLGCRTVGQSPGDACSAGLAGAFAGYGCQVQKANHSSDTRLKAPSRHGHAMACQGKMPIIVRREACYQSEPTA